jgi:GTP-binding protein EngB required for normal cell division
MNIKNILLIGRTGGGKSTLANVLVNQFKNNEPFREVFKESAGSTSQTKEIQIKEFIINITEDGSEKIRYLVVDTAGFGDTQLTTKEVLQLLEGLVEIIGNDGINQIFLVSGGRFTREEIDVYGLLESVLFDRDVVNYTTIARTRFPDFEDETKCETDRKKLREENNELLGILKNSKIIYVDNPPLTGRSEVIEINKEVRKVSREVLTMYLMGCQGIYKPVNLNTLKQRINNYKTKAEQLQKELQDKEQTRQQREAQLQQQISSLQTQQQDEIYRTQQNFNNQLNSAYAEQQRQINEINERHQQELTELRGRYSNQYIYEIRCQPQGHFIDTMQAAVEYDYMVNLANETNREKNPVCPHCRRHAN